MLTELDRASQGGGYAGTLLMGLTFSLTSFACVGPIVGPLLVASVQDEGRATGARHGSFRDRTRSPFFFLALFPAYLKKLPRSGGWLARVKVVMGFILLAVMFKYLSNIDQVLQTHWLNPRAIPGGVVRAFAMAGLYLLGLLRLEGIRRRPLGSGPRSDRGVLSSIFAFSLLPGMFGAPLGELDAYVPGLRPPAASAGTALPANSSKTISTAALDGGDRTEQTGPGEFHRVRLHQLPLDEGQHVPSHRFGLR